MSVRAPSAVTKDASASAPDPSIAAEIDVTVDMTWCATFSTASAVAGSTSSENGLNCVGSTPSGRPRIAPTSSPVNPVSSMMVVVGETIPEPAGAFKITFSRLSPDELSTVDASVLTVNDTPRGTSSKEKFPSASVSTQGSSSSRLPSELRSRNTVAFSKGPLMTAPPTFPSCGGVGPSLTLL